MQNFENVETLSNRNQLVQLGLSNILGLGIKKRETESNNRNPNPSPKLGPSQPETSKRFSKRDYNKAYYQQRKLLKNQESAAPTEALKTCAALLQSGPSLANEAQKEIPWKKIAVVVETLALLILVGFMTALLIRESAHFYLDFEDAPCLAYLKAAMIESLAILFSFSRSRCKALRLAQWGLVIMLCIFTLSLMSGKAFKAASSDTIKVEAVKKALEQLENELAQKEKLRNEFLNKGWLSMTRRYEKAVDQTRNKLSVVRNELCSLQTPGVIAQNLGILIAFRVLLVVANLVSIHRVVELFTSNKQRNNPEKVKKMTKKMSESV